MALSGWGSGMTLGPSGGAEGLNTHTLAGPLLPRHYTRKTLRSLLCPKGDGLGGGLSSREISNAPLCMFPPPVLFRAIYFVWGLIDVMFCCF